MTDKELKTKILVEIERLRKNLPWGGCASQLLMECNCKNDAYTEIEKFIDSLSEDPASIDKDVARMADEFAEREYETNGYEREWLSKGYYHGFMDANKGKLKEPVSKDLNEAAVKYAYENWQSDDYHEGAADGLPFDAIGHTEKCFMAGAKWQKEKSINKACESFCKVECNGKPPHSTCTSLGTCKKYDDFRKVLKED